MNTKEQLMLDATGVCKQFGDNEVLVEVDLQLTDGTVFGLVGDTGAGKTTLLNILSGLLPADEGEVRIAGSELWSKQTPVRQRIGVPCDPAANAGRFTLREWLVCVAMMRIDSPMPQADDLDRVLAAVELARPSTRVTAELSPGERARLGLASALLNHTDLLILDEPFECIDPFSGGIMSRVLRDFAARGGTVVVSGTAAGPLLPWCDRVGTLTGRHLIS